jgi:hypothetical protein
MTVSFPRAIWRSSHAGARPARRRRRAQVETERITVPTKPVDPRQAANAIAGRAGKGPPACRRWSPRPGRRSWMHILWRLGSLRTVMQRERPAEPSINGSATRSTI